MQTAALLERRLELFYYEHLFMAYEQNFFLVRLVMGNLVGNLR